MKLRLEEVMDGLLYAVALLICLGLASVLFAIAWVILRRAW